MRCSWRAAIVAALSALVANTANAFMMPGPLRGSVASRSSLPWFSLRRASFPSRARTMMSWRLPKKSPAPKIQGPHIDSCFESNLSKRLGSVATMVEDGACVLDIGTDHGYLPIALLESGRASKVIACDKNELPLQNAEANLKLLDRTICDKLELRLGDGLRVLQPGEADTVTTSGIGGKFIAEILFGRNFLQRPRDETALNALKPDNESEEEDQHPDLRELGVARLILQPTSYIEGLRKALAVNGWSVDSETVFTEGRFLYITLVAVPAESPAHIPHSDEDLFLGPVLRRLPQDAEERLPYAIWLRHQLSHYTSRRDGLRLMLQGRSQELDEAGGGELAGEDSDDSEHSKGEPKRLGAQAQALQLQRQLARAEWQVALLGQELRFCEEGHAGEEHASHS